MKKTTPHKKITFRFICLILYIISAVVLIVEASMNGASSSSQSNAVGGTIAGLINDFKGDQTVATKPTSIMITNKIDIGYVGDKYLIKTNTLPENSTFKKVEYRSSDLSVASIDNDGLISFIDQGEVTITTLNADFPEIKDQFKINVLEVPIQSVEHSLNAAQNEEGVYVIYADIYDYDETFDSYVITTKINPTNATHQDITYSVDNESYLKIDENGVITPLKYSNNKVTTINIKVGDKEEQLKVIVDLKSVVHVSEINISQTSYIITKTQQLTLNVDIKPTNATFKGYTLKSANTAVAKINGNKIVGAGKGNTQVTLTMSNYPSLTKTIDIEVKEQPSVTSFATQSSLTVTEGRTIKISISQVTPSYADTSSVSYQSSDTSVATVTNAGVIKGITQGSCQITTTINGISKTTNVTVNPKTDFVDYLALSDDIDRVLYIDEVYDLPSLLDVSNIKYYKDNQECTVLHKQFTYIVNDETVAAITSTTLTTLALGEITLTLIHDSSGANIELSFVIIDNFNVTAIQNAISTPLEIIEANPFTLNVNEILTYKIDDSNLGQEYRVEEIDTTNTVINLETGKILASTNGNIRIEITPIVISENEELRSLVYNRYTYVLNLTINHIYNRNENVQIYVSNAITNEAIIINDNNFKMFISDKINVQAKKDSLSTISGLRFVSSDEKILKIDNLGNLLPQSIGNVDLILKDDYSSTVDQTLHISIGNKILIDENNAISVSGHDAKYDQENDIYEITNGHSGKIKINFLSESTYKKVSYSSSNVKILEVGQDGTLTPLKQGKVVVTLTIDDGMQTPIEVDVTILVKPQKVIENINSFLRMIRKALGHFGAFLVLGFFSTFAYLLYFKNKKWFFSVPLNFVQGFLIAALTEYIQLFVPGRSGLWSDVILDTTGFMLSAVILTISILGYYLFKYLKNKKKILTQGSEVSNEEKEN